MARTELRSAQIKDATIGRLDLDVATPGSAVVAKIVAGSGVSISSTGADTGTGDVTITATGVPVVHAPTHNTGGSDPLTALSGNIITTGTVGDARLSGNVALKNINNAFTVVQQVTSASTQLQLQGTGSAGIQLIRSDGGVDAKRFGVYTTGALFLVAPYTDAVAGQPTVFSIDRLGNAAILNTLALGTTPATVGMIRLPVSGAIWWRNQANTANVGLHVDTGSNLRTTGIGIIAPSADGEAALGNVSYRFSNQWLRDYMLIGTNAASNGAVRLPSNAAIMWRNAANSADIAAVQVSTSDQLHLRSPNAAVVVAFGPHSVVFDGVNNDVYPNADGTLLLGAPGVRWSTIYSTSLDVSGGIYAAGGLSTTPLDASQLTSGTVPDTRLSSNVALKNTINWFTAQQGITGGSTQLHLQGVGSAGLQLTQTDGAVDAKTFGIYNGDNALWIAPYTDVGGILPIVFSVRRTGDVTVLGQMTAAGLNGTPLNATNLTSGTVPDARLSINVLKHTGGYPGGTTTYLRADGTFAAPTGGAGTGDVVGPASATDNALVRFDGTTGKLVQNSTVLVDDPGDLTIRKVRPTLILNDPAGPTKKGRVHMAVNEARLDLTANMYYNGTNWMRDDVAIPGIGILLNTSGSVWRFRTVTGAADPGTLSDIMYGDLTGNVWGIGTLSMTWDVNAGRSLAAGIDVILGAAQGKIRTNTVDGSDSKGVILCGGGDSSPNRGAMIQVYGNESAYPGHIYMDMGSPGAMYIRNSGYASMVTIANNGDLSNYYRIFPGRVDATPGIQNAWYLGTHGSYGLYTNTGLYIAANLVTGGYTICGSYINLQWQTLYYATLQGYVEVSNGPAISGGWVTFDLAIANIFDIYPTAGNFNVNIANARGTIGHSFTVICHYGSTVTGIGWPSNVRWPNDVVPTPSPNGYTDVFSFILRQSVWLATVVQRLRWY